MVNGPPYPHPNPVPGSNAIGSFAIGISPIGDIPAFDFWQTVINQYANSPRLTGIIKSFNDAIDQTEDFSNFYDLMWNVATAQGYGLDCWGRIVGVTRTVSLAGSNTYLGFEEASSWTGFGQGGFYTGGSITNNFSLLDADFRTLIYAKALGNISDGSIPSINNVLLTLFPGRGPAWVTTSGLMQLTYNFSFQLSAIEAAIVGQQNVLPAPAGVAVLIAQGVPVP